MNLVIVESPTKSRSLSRYLGSDYKIMASMGHLRDLPKGDLGVEVKNNFRGTYIPVPGKEEVIKGLKKEAKKAKKVVLAMDPDREGEAIAFHIIKLLEDGGKEEKFSRIVFHEITKNAILNALKSPRSIDESLVNSQKTRRVLDRLVGYKLSPLLWRKVRRGLSAGRVQSPALRLIVEREREIENFKRQEYWLIKAKLRKESPSYDVEAMLIRIEDKKAEINNKKTSQAVVKDLEKAKYEVLKIKLKRFKKSPAPPFTTSTLQQAASRLFYWSGRKTMREAQRLYEEGLITYHRTDSLNLAQSAIKSARIYINSIYGKEYLPEKPRFYKTKSKLAQEAHEAIRVTRVKRKTEEVVKRLDKQAAKLYQLIFNRFLASQMKSQELERLTLEIEGKAKKSYLLRSKEEQEIFPGWRKVYEEKSKIQKGDSSGMPKSKVKDLREGDKLKLLKIIPEQKFTQPPGRFTEGTLVKALEEYGIGRPSTYAPIIFTIQRRQYVEKEEGHLKPTEVGIAVNDFLCKFFTDIMDYDFTASMEDDLDNIAQNQVKKLKVLRSFWRPFSSKLNKVAKEAKRVKIETEKTGKKCPTCKKGEVVIRRGKYGKFFSCSRFPKCDYKASFIEKIKGVKCPFCGGDIVVRFTKKRRRFYGCSNYPSCKWASWRNPKKKA